MKKMKVAVMNTSHEVTEVVKAVFEDDGFDTVDIFTYKLKHGEVKFQEFIDEHHPDVILYDIAIPYEENYMLFLALAKNMAVRKIPFILTTTNKERLEELVGETNAYEIVGKPYDLEELVVLVNKAIKNKQAVAA